MSWQPRTDILLSEMGDFERQFNRFWMHSDGLYFFYLVWFAYYFKSVAWRVLLMVEWIQWRRRCLAVHQARTEYRDGH